MKVSATIENLAIDPTVDLQYVLFGRPEVKQIGLAGPTLLDDLTRYKIAPSQVALDLLAIGLSVCAADEGCSRARSSDGWTREIDLDIAVHNPGLWSGQKGIIEQMLKVLTNDVWNLDFLPNGAVAAQQQIFLRDENCISLLSGGADSLCGAIDLVRSGESPFFVSQVAKGDKETQTYFADTIFAPGHHLQLNHKIKCPSISERSQRGRSIIFLCYAVLAATNLLRYRDGERIPIYIPENGFISLNIPLTPLRIGSLSTRTTHPTYIALFQRLLDTVGLNVSLTNSWQFKTKGEMLAGCADQDLLKRLIFPSTSCGRFARCGFKHCGRCVPCLIRRAAIHHWGVADQTVYVYADLSLDDDKHRRFDDVASASYAFHTVQTKGLDKWIGGSLSSAQLGDITPYRDVASRGIIELGTFLQHVDAL